MKKTSKVISVILSVLMLMQMMTGVVFAADQDLVWTCEDLGQKKVDVFHGKEPYSDVFGVRFTDKSTDKYGTMDKNGNIIIPATYNNILDFYGNQYLSVAIDRKSGIVNAKQEFVVELGKYDMISKFNDTSFIAQKNNKFGLVSTNDEVIIDLVYDLMDTTTDGNILARKDNKYSILDKSGKELSLKDMDCKDGHITVNLARTKYPFYINPDGSLSDYKLQYSYIGEYYIRDITDKYYCVYKEGAKLGLTDKNMNIILPCEYTVLEPSAFDDVFVAEKEGMGKQYIDTSGNPVEYLNKYKDPVMTSSGYIIGKDENYNNGMIDKNGNIIIPFEYSNIVEIARDVFYLKTDTQKEGIAAFGAGKRVKDTFEGLILTIGSNKAKAFNEDVELDAVPIIRNGRTMLPARFVAENLGATVDWKVDTQTVLISLNNSYGHSIRSIEITIGSENAAITEQGHTFNFSLDAPAFIENGRTYVPVRFISENLYANVFWEESTQTIKILK
mgnify:CR=1 FL=1